MKLTENDAEDIRKARWMTILLMLSLSVLAVLIDM